MSKFHVEFSARSASISSASVFVSPSAIPNYFAVAVLYITRDAGSWQSERGLAVSLKVEQNLLRSETEAMDWATNWLEEKAGVPVSLSQVAD